MIEENEKVLSYFVYQNLGNCLVDQMTINKPSILNASYSLRELDANSTYERY